MGAIIPPPFLDPTVPVFGIIHKFPLKKKKMLLETQILVENGTGLNLAKSLSSNLKVN